MDVTEWFLFYFIISGTFARSTYKGCTVEKTYGHGYFRYFPTELLSTPKPENVGLKSEPGAKNSFYFEFYVKTTQDAHILLAEKEDGIDGYEVVLGGGNNSFCQIRVVRRQFRRAVKNLKVNNTITAQEHKGFWINYDNAGNILVGKIGENDGFLSWKDKMPIEVSVVAFSSWTNVKAEWYFACSNTNQDETPEDRNITAIQRLKNDLFTDYNPRNFPQQDGNPEQTVELNIEATHFGFDEKYGELQLSGITHLKWNDWKLTWNETEYSKINVIFVSAHQVWTPNIHVLNSVTFDSKSLLQIKGGVALKNDGEMTWRAPFHSNTFCILGYRNWPYDSHNCSLIFGFLTEPLKIDIKTVVFPKSSKSPWEIENIEGRQSISQTDGNKYGVIHIRLQLRDPSITQITIFPTFLCAAALSLLSFWINPNSPVKLFLNCGSVFILIITLVVVGNCLPSTKMPTPEIVRLYSMGVLAMCIPILLFIGLKYVPSNVVLPDIFVQLLNSTSAEILFCFPEKPKRESQNSSERDHRQDSNNAVRLVLLIERFVFVFYFTTLVIPFFLNTSIFGKLSMP